MKKVVVWSVILLALLSLLSACGGGGGGGGGTPTTSSPPPSDATLLNITVTASDTNIVEGGATQFSAVGTYSDGKTYTITSQVAWSSNDTGVVTVSSAGLASGISVGTAVVEASLDGVSAFETLSVSLNVPGGGGDEGSTSSPVLLQVGQPYTGTAGGFGSHYYFQTGSAGEYSIALEDTLSRLTWILFDNSNFFSPEVAYCSGSDTSNNVRCSATLEASTYYYITVTNWDFDNATFNIIVKEGLGEGSVASPQSVHLGLRSTDIAANSSNYYEFVPPADGSYSISLDGEVGASVYSSPDFSSGELNTCVADFEGSVCAVNGLLSGTSYYIKLDEPTGSSQCFDVKLESGLSDGSLASPQLITISSAYTGGVDAWGDSYYQFTTPAGEAGSYMVSLSNVALLDSSLNEDTYLSNYVDLNVYSDSSFSTLVNSCKGFGGCSVSGLEPSSTYYVQVDNFTTYYSYTSSDITYDITVAPGSCVGSLSAPYPLTVGVEYSGNMDSSCTSWFSFTTTDSGSYDSVSANLPGYGYWKIYSDPDFTAQVDYWTTSTAGTVVTDNLDEATTYYLEVENSSTSGPIQFALSPGTSEGSVNTPVALGIDSKHTGSVAANGFSYYSFTAPADGDYSVVVNNAAPMYFLLHTQQDYSGPEICYQGYKTYPQCSVAATAGSTYYFRVEASYTSDQSYDIEVMSQDVTAGCSASALLCEDFEGTLPAEISTTTTPPWSIVGTENTTSSGANSFSSGSLNNSDRACFSFTPPMETWMFLYNFKISGRDSNFQFLVNGNTHTAAWHTNTEWKRAAFTTTPGVNTYTICYDRMYNSSGVTEAMWIDDIEFR